MPTRRRPSLPVSATEWIASANMLADPDSAAAANLTTATQEFEINAATTLRREPCSEPSPPIATLYPRGLDYCADAVGRGVGSAARPRGGEGLMDGELISFVSFPLIQGSDTLKAITIPLFTGAIGYVINWTGVWMLFNPIRFKGMRFPGLAPLARLLPRKLQEIPGIMHGGVGWQGIIPSRAAKMGSIATDKGIAKVGSPADFYQQLEPEVIAEHMIASSQRDIREVVERIMRREDPELWRDLPPRVREAVHARVQEQLPDIVREVTEEIGDNIDQLLDVKLMVIRRMEERPELANRVFLEVGRRELRLMINLGFVFGLLLGIPVVGITFAFPYWWALPVCGVVVGWVTNLLAIYMIFEPVQPRRVGPVVLHGLFLR